MEEMRWYERLCWWLLEKLGMTTTEPFIRDGKLVSPEDSFDD